VSGFPPHDLECPDPESCTGAVEGLTSRAGSGTLPTVTVPQDRRWFRVYDSVDGYALPNPGFGDTRFAPFDALGSEMRVPTFYLAETLEAALLESSLHSVAIQEPRVVDEVTLVGKLHAEVVPPHALTLVDLRDPSLLALGLTRDNLASSSPEHYPCTRRVARAIHAGVGHVQGITWHSRQAELTGRPPQEVAVVFADRVSASRGAWRLAPRRTAVGSLLEGSGKLLLDDLAEKLDVTFETSSHLDE